MNDGSPDDSEEAIRALSAPEFPRVLGITHSRNFGSQAAFRSGMELAAKNAVVLMDGDLQDPPELIPEFVAKWREGFDVVYGERTKREAAVVHAASPTRRSTGCSIISPRCRFPHDAGDFSLIDRRVVRWLLDLRRARPVPAGTARLCRLSPDRRALQAPGAHVRALHQQHAQEFRLGEEGDPVVQPHAARSAHVLGRVAGAGLGVARRVLQFLARVFYPELAPRGITTVVLLIMFFGSFTIFAISLIGEYIAKIFEEVKARPTVHPAPPDPRRRDPQSGRRWLTGRCRGKTCAARVRTGRGSQPGSRAVRAFRPPPHERSAGRVGASARAPAGASPTCSSGRSGAISRGSAAGGGDARDVGAGAQPFRDLVPPEGALHRGRHRGGGAPIRLSRRRTRATSAASVLPLADGEADTVLCTETLEHVREPRAFLARAAGVRSRPAGCSILTVPFAARWHFVPQDYWRFTPSGLEHLLTRRRISRSAHLSRAEERWRSPATRCSGSILLLLAGSDGGRRGPARAARSGSCALPAAALAARRRATSGSRFREPRRTRWATRCWRARRRSDATRWPLHGSGVLRPRACPVCGNADETHERFPSASIPARLGALSYASRKEPEYMSLRMVVCPGCDLLYAPRVPSAEYLAARLCRDGLRQRRRSALRGGRATPRHCAPRLGRAARPESALEIGTGNGALLAHLRALGFAEVLGIEPSLAAVGFGGARCAAADPRRELRSERACPQSHFSLIIANQTHRARGRIRLALLASAARRS